MLFSFEVGESGSQACCLTHVENQQKGRLEGPLLQQSLLRIVLWRPSSMSIVRTDVPPSIQAIGHSLFFLSRKRQAIVGRVVDVNWASMTKFLQCEGSRRGVERGQPTRRRPTPDDSLERTAQR